MRSTYTVIQVRIPTEGKFPLNDHLAWRSRLPGGSAVGKPTHIIWGGTGTLPTRFMGNTAIIKLVDPGLDIGDSLLREVILTSKQLWPPASQVGRGCWWGNKQGWEYQVELTLIWTVPKSPVWVEQQKQITKRRTKNKNGKFYVPYPLSTYSVPFWGRWIKSIPTPPIGSEEIRQLSK